MAVSHPNLCMQISGGFVLAVSVRKWKLRVSAGCARTTSGDENRSWEGGMRNSERREDKLSLVGRMKFVEERGSASCLSR